MAAKIAAAVKARRHLRIIARTDAIASEGLEAAIKRAQMYRAAGADVIFPEALIDADAMAQFTAAVDAPMLANMTEFGKTPYLSAAEFQALGFAIVIWPVTSCAPPPTGSTPAIAIWRRMAGRAPSSIR